MSEARDIVVIADALLGYYQMFNILQVNDMYLQRRKSCLLLSN